SDLQGLSIGSWVNYRDCVFPCGQSRVADVERERNVGEHFLSARRLRLCSQRKSAYENHDRYRYVQMSFHVEPPFLAFTYSRGRLARIPPRRHNICCKLPRLLAYAVV